MGEETNEDDDISDDESSDDESGDNDSSEGKQEDVECEEKYMSRRKRRKRMTKGRKKRGRRKRKTDKVSLTIMHINPRGWISKQDAIMKMTKAIDPDIININETQLSGNAKIQIKSFVSFSRNRSDKRGGGICSVVSNRIKEHAVCVAEGEEEDEWLAVRYDHVSPALTLVNCYGEQEGSGIGRSSKEEVAARWGRLLKVLETARLRGDHVLLVGDLNKHVGNDNLGVPGNTCEISSGGRLVRDLVEGGQWRLLNAEVELIKGGPFTRRDPASGKESLLDLWVCTAGLAPHLKELIIDSSRRWEVARPVLKDGRLQLTHSDHYTMVATFQNLPSAKVAREEQEVRWKTGNKESWTKYKEESKKASKKITETVENKKNDINEVLNKVEAIETKMKFKTFGKCTVKSMAKRKEKIKKNEMHLTEEEKAILLLKNQTKRVDEAVSKVEQSGLNKVGQIFKITQEIKGVERGASRANAIKHPTTGKLIVDQQEIKETSVKYCKKVLTKNEPKEEFKTMAKIKQMLHDKRMKENIGKGFEADKEVFDTVIDKFKMNNKRSYDFIVNSSHEFKDSIYKLCKRIIEDETVPVKFRNTTLHQIWKRKPGTKKEDLQSNRYIHCKESYLPRAVESMVVKEMEPSILAATSIFQIGGVPGHRPQEHLFCLKSLQEKYQRDKKLLILYPHDASQFFDKEVLVDCMGELYEAGIDPRAYRLFYYLNQETRIRVKTGCGFSGWEEAGDGLGQGSGGAAKVSALNLDKKLKSVFGSSKEMLNYGSVKQRPYCFQDDALCMVDKVEHLGVVVHGMETVMGMMQVESNQSKCGYILLGPKHLVEEARKYLEERPIRVGDWVVQELHQEKWLGDQICNGLKQSIMATIQSRAPKIRRAAYEIVNIVRDYRAQRIGGFATALLLWEACAIPSLIYNCSTWAGMGRAEEEALAECQDFFLRLVLASGPGAPKHSLRADFGVQSMKLRVWREKLMLVHHIRNLENEALAKTMYMEQMKNNWPGLAKESEQLCEKLQIQDVNETAVSKKVFSKIAKEACHKLEDVVMKSETCSMEKMRKIRAEVWGMKHYVKTGTLHSVRSTWEVRSYMLHVAGNYSHHQKYAATGWRCQGCSLQVREDQDHITRCQGYSDLLQGKDLADDEQLVDFYRRVMARREEQGWD